MRRGIGRLRAGGAGFNPISVFAGSAAGLWLDPSDISTGFQDSAGTTPQTASGQPTGKRLDKSGRGNHVLQATSLARPEYDLISGISSDFFDGSDDLLATSAFIAGTLTADMDCFIAIKRSAANIVCAFNNPGAATQFFGAASAAVSGTIGSSAGAGTATVLVNGVAVNGGTAAQEVDMSNALTANSWCVAEFRNLNLSTWTQFTIGRYSAGYAASDDCGGVILCPAQSATNRTNLRRWLGAKVGLAL